MTTESARTGAPVKHYRHPMSGHCHRAELMLNLLEVPYENVEVDLASGAHKQPEYLQLNPLGLVPSIEDNGAVIADSVAILTYLVETYGDADQWRGRTPAEKAEVQRWLSIAAGEMTTGPCAARLVKVFNAPLDHAAAVKKSRALLAFMDAHLKDRTWLAAERATLADISAYSYIAHAPEGAVDLKPFAHVLAWLARVEALPNFIGMVKSPDLS